MTLLGKAKPDILQKRWIEITEQYYRNVDESSFEIFLKDKKKDIKWELEYVKMMSGFQLALLGMEKGFDILKSLGIKGNDLKKIEQKIKGRITNHNIKSNEEKYEKEPVDFYELWAEVRKAGYDVNENISLIAWVGVLKSIRKSNERNNSKE